MAEFKKIETQEELDKIVEERLARERKKTSTDHEAIKTENERLAGELAEVKKTLEAATAESTGFKAKIEELNGKVSGYETEKMKVKVATQYGLPYDLSSRLVGSSEDELEADAAKMSELLKSGKEPAPLKSTEPATGEDAYKNLLSGLKGE